MLKYYTGVGSRQTPQDILELMGRIAARLYSEGYILRSGGAPGADSAFENGVVDSIEDPFTVNALATAGSLFEIYLPWKGFNGNNSSLYAVASEAMELASKIHPAWNKLSLGAKKLHARNCYQVLGWYLNTLSEFLVCWTPSARETGGTRTAIVLAASQNIPIWNLANNSHREFIENNMSVDSADARCPPLGILLGVKQ